MELEASDLLKMFNNFNERQTTDAIHSMNGTLFQIKFNTIHDLRGPEKPQALNTSGGLYKHWLLYPVGKR